MKAEDAARAPLLAKLSEQDAEIERLKARESDEEILVRMLAACVKAEKAERERDERAAWLAQFVIDRHDGTHDLPAWVAQSARFWRDLCNERDELRAQLEALQQLELTVAAERGEWQRQLEAVRKDAERYRWMRPFMFAGSSYYSCINTRAYVDNPKGHHLEFDSLDEAIDAARAEKPDPLEGKLGMWPAERLK